MAHSGRADIGAWNTLAANATLRGATGKVAIRKMNMQDLSGSRSCPKACTAATGADALEAIVDLDFTALWTSSCRKDMITLLPIREGSLIRAELGA